MKEIPWKQLMVAGVLVAAVILVLPTFNPDWWPHKTINLGLDLQGGMHLILEVDTEKAVAAQIDRQTRELRERIREERLRHTDIEIQEESIQITARGEENINALKSLLDEEFRGLALISDRKSNGRLVQ
ncbi:MAG: protein translocase subunit SecD, partial [Desulfosudaceae bacterium]